MEVHPPHSQIHGFKDFLVHLGTITVGLLIALALEGSVEWLHHRHQLTEARESIRAELEVNRNELENFQPKLRREQKALEELLETVRAVRDHRPTPKPSQIFLVGSSLSHASWDTAQSSGALTLMPYHERSGFAEIYQVQGVFDALEGQTINAFAPILGSLPGADETKVATLSESALDALERNVENSLGHCQVLYGTASELAKEYRGMR